LVALKKCAPARSGSRLLIPKLNPTKSAGTVGAPGAGGLSVTETGDCAKAAPTSRHRAAKVDIITAGGVRL